MIQETRRTPSTVWGKNILDRLDNMEITITQFAKLLGMTQAGASFFITGGGGCTLERLLQICDLLSCTPNEILGYAEVTEPVLAQKYQNAIRRLGELLDE